MSKSPCVPNGEQRCGHDILTSHSRRYGHQGVHWRATKVIEVEPLAQEDGLRQPGLFTLEKTRFVNVYWWWVVKTVSFQGCVMTGPESLWRICHWRWIVWTWFWANNCGWLGCAQTSLDKLQRSLPTSDLFLSCHLSSLSTSHFLPCHYTKILIFLSFLYYLFT